MTKAVTQQGLISDANVLIDYKQSAPGILQLVSKHIQQLYVALPILQEVRDLSADQVEKLDIEVVEPSLDQLVEASELRLIKPGLSGTDALCFVMARDSKWTCLTNDKALRRYCTSCKVECMWGLEVMILLVTSGQITAARAYTLAQDIQSKNKYIKDETVERFRRTLGLK